MEAPDALLFARLQMAFTLGVHIVVACFGVGLPVLMLAAEGFAIRTGDATWRLLARRWAKAFAVLFAVGAVSGTVLSFELGLLWPRFMGTFGSVIGLPFTLEGFAFFLEAIFAGIYLYGWDRLSKRAHWLCGVPIALAGLASAWFVVTANAWMNAPAGFTMVDGVVTDVDPIAAMLNAATWAQTAHMIVAAYMVTGFCVASYYALRLLKGSDAGYSKRALALGLVLGCAFAPIQILVGHWAGQTVAETQPVKLAAMEGQFRSESSAPLRIGGIPDPSRMETPWAIEIPGGLSWMAYGEREAHVRGLEEFPRDEWPPVRVVHIAFQVMVASGTALAALAAWAALAFLWRRKLPSSRAFRLVLVAAGPLSVIALEAGWVVTEVGRQPWIVQGIMRTSEAVTDAPGLALLFVLTVGIYVALLTGAATVLALLARKPLVEDESGS